MKKSKFITLVLVTSLTVGCHKKEKEKENLYIRGDQDDSYTQVQDNHFFFYPNFFYTDYGYGWGGYNNRYISPGIVSSRSARISSKSSFSSSSRSSVSRGGFGRSGVSSGS